MYDPVILTEGMPTARPIRVAKHGHAGGAYGGSKMHRTAVVTDKKGRALHQSRTFSRARFPAQIERLAWPRSCDTIAAVVFVLGSQEYYCESGVFFGYQVQ